MSMKALTGIRGLCSLIIVTGHFFTFLAPSFDFTIDYLSPVSLFFVQSGLLLGLFYEDKLDTPKQRKDFWIKRFARIAPMYYFSLLLTIPDMILFVRKISTTDFILSLIFTPLFLQSLTVAGSFWNFPLWQISAFAICYAIYPFILKPLKSKYGLAIGIASYITQVLIFLGVYFGKITKLLIIHKEVLVRAPSFFLGVLLGLKLHAQNEEERKSTENSSSKPKWNRYTLGVELTTLFLTLATVLSILMPYINFIGAFPFMYWCQFLLSPVYCLWFYFICKAPEGGLTIPFFSSWIMVNLGEISYSLYVLQWPVMEAYSLLRVWAISYPKGTLADSELLGVLCTLICASLVCYHYIENPARKWITDKLSKPATPRYEVVPNDRL